MKRNLVIDQGNSSVKAALYHGDTLKSEAQCGSLDELRMMLAITVESEGPVDAAIYSTVAPDEAQTLEAMLGVFAPRVLRLTHSLPLPVSIRYDHPERLGPDRIAAVAGAHARCPGCEMLVVDAGTAVTYDVLRADGTFDGGNIAPGISMRLYALWQFTAALPEVRVPKSFDANSPFGHNTTEAMTAGAVMGVVGETAYYRSLLGADARIMLTGGNAPMIAEALRTRGIEVTVDTHLVTYGLNRILQYNENK